MGEHDRPVGREARRLIGHIVARETGRWTATVRGDAPDLLGWRQARVVRRRTPPAVVHDGLPVRRPGRELVLHVVERQPLRAVGTHDIDLPVAVRDAGERELRPVRRPGRHLDDRGARGVRHIVRSGAIGAHHHQARHGGAGAAATEIDGARDVRDLRAVGRDGQVPRIGRQEPERAADDAVGADDGGRERRRATAELRRRGLRRAEVAAVGRDARRHDNRPDRQCRDQRVHARLPPVVPPALSPALAIERSGIGTHLLRHQTEDLVDVRHPRAPSAARRARRPWVARVRTVPGRTRRMCAACSDG